jgi:SAM-dependent methyltransferase
MPTFVAGALVFATSGAVLILEILAARLLAPYVGNSLETYSGIIGTVLAGIAIGTWAGGRLADRIDPRRLIGPILVLGGALAVSSVPIVRGLGQASTGTTDDVLLLSVCGFLPAAAVLSAVSPVVIKQQLHDLSITGQVVGRLSALGTAGAIAGTVLAGFVLIEAAPTSVTIYVIGGLLVLVGVVAWVVLDRLRPGPVAAAAAVVLAGVGLGSVVDDPCQAETTYHCASIEPDAARPGGRVLRLDTLRHSYVDLDDPAHLEFGYTQVFGAALDAARPGDDPVEALHIGGGAWTMPRWLEATRPGSTSEVLEIDGGLVDLVRDELPPGPEVDVEVRVGDGRLLVTDVADGSQDVVFGDAFAGLAAPWHLTTEEFVGEVHRVLRPSGLYVVNLIDRPPLRFVRAEVATLARVFDHVALVAPASVLDGTQAANVVLLASDEPLPTAALRDLLAERGVGQQVVDGDELVELVDGAPVLTDDYAPVDQWLVEGRR